MVRLGTLKFAHYGAVWYMKEIAPKYNLEIKESVFPKGIDIIPAIIAGEIDVAASAVDGAIAARAGNVPIVIVAGFAKGGARIVGRSDVKWNSVADLKGKRSAFRAAGRRNWSSWRNWGNIISPFRKNRTRTCKSSTWPMPIWNQALMAKNIDAMCQSEPQSTQAISKGFGVEIIKPYDTPIGEPVRTLIMTEAMYNTRKDVAKRFMKCFVEATKYFIDNPKAAEQYVREKMFKGQLTAEDYHDAIDNSSFTYDVTVQQVQVSTDMMVKYGIGKMAKPPAAKDYVKLDLLEKAKKELKVK